MLLYVVGSFKFDSEKYFVVFKMKPLFFKNLIKTNNIDKFGEILQKFIISTHAVCNPNPLLIWKLNKPFVKENVNISQCIIIWQGFLFKDYQFKFLTVMGLTIDMEKRSVYWIVRSYEGSSLFQAATADKLKFGEEIQPQKISSLQHPNIQGKVNKNTTVMVCELIYQVKS